MVVFLAGGQALWAQELLFDFRGGQFNDQLFRFVGERATEIITRDAGGLRWHFTQGKAPRQPVGIHWRSGISGDFVATARYEMASGAAAGFEIYLMLDNPTKDGVALAHLWQTTLPPASSLPQASDDGKAVAAPWSASDATLITFNHMTNTPEGKRFAKVNRNVFVSPGNQGGRLRLAREGDTIIASRADGDDQQFTELIRAEVGVNDIRMVRMAGLSLGQAGSELDMLLLEARLDAVVPELQGKGGTVVKKRGWLLWGGILTVFAIALGTAALLVVRKRRAPRQSQAEHMKTSRPAPAAKIPRRAYSLIEVLVCMGILAILLTLLVSAIQFFRQAAARTQCAFNLNQIGQAFHMHHEQLRFLPTAGTDWGTPPTYVKGIPTRGSEQGAGWAFQILPYLDSNDVWLGGGATTDLERQLVAVAATNPLYFCPARREPMTVTYNDGYLSRLAHAPVTHALCDYACANLDDGEGAVRANRYGRPLTLDDITDGLSNTLLVGEKKLNLYYLGKPGRSDDNEGYSAGNDWDTMRNTVRPPSPDTNEATAENGFASFGSSHPSGLNVLFADGSLRHLSYSVDATIFARLGTRADGLPVTLDAD
jgi:prepilin-type N-terminal cleavage/methylation domain-containing protein/prepilin-type processing-associated H-X9-DG protein